MTTAPPPATPDAHSQDSLRVICAELQRFLRESKRAADEEIGSYPTPIPRCDAQFNHVYDLRSRLAEALHRVDAALDGDPFPQEAWGAVTAFLASPPMGETALEAELRRRLRNEIEQRRNASAGIDARA